MASCFVHLDMGEDVEGWHTGEDPIWPEDAIDELGMILIGKILFVPGCKGKKKVMSTKKMARTDGGAGAEGAATSEQGLSDHDMAPAVVIGGKEGEHSSSLRLFKDLLAIAPWVPNRVPSLMPSVIEIFFSLLSSVSTYASCIDGDWVPFGVVPSGDLELYLREDNLYSASGSLPSVNKDGEEGTILANPSVYRIYEDV